MALPSAELLARASCNSSAPVQKADACNAASGKASSTASLRQAFRRNQAIPARPRAKNLMLYGNNNLVLLLEIEQPDNVPDLKPARASLAAFQNLLSFSGTAIPLRYWMRPHTCATTRRKTLVPVNGPQLAAFGSSLELFCCE